MATTREYRGRRVLGGKKGKRKIGKVGATVFYPAEARVVGFVVKRPDFLWMVKRKDKFLAFDAFSLVDGRLIANKGGGSWDEEALKRLDVNYDACIIWENMPIKTEDDFELGRVGVVSFERKTGKVISATSIDSATSRALLGTYEIPLDMIVGYRKGFLVVRSEARDVEASGGLAAKAGAGVAKASAGASKAAKKTGEAVNEGAYALGGVIGKAKSKMTERAAEDEETQELEAPAKTGKLLDEGAYALGGALGKAKKALSGEADTKESSQKKDSSSDKPAAKGMFAAFKDEYKKSFHGDDE